MEEKWRDAGTLAAAGSAGDSPASEATSTRRRVGVLKRKANAFMSSNSSSTPSKRMNRDKAMLVSTSPVHNGPLTRARQAPSNVASSAPGVVADVKQELVNAAAGAEVERPKEEEELNKAIREWEALEAKIEAEFEAIRSRDSNAHVVPNHCGWFCWQKIHPLEERSLPSFFNGKHDGRSPELYMEIRNWILRKFHSDPNTQIELKDLSELEAGDLDAKQEVMEFLDYWGLINFHPFPPVDSSLTAVDDEEVEDKGSLIDNIYRFQAVEPYPAFVHKPHFSAQAMPARLFPESMVADDLLKQEGPSVEYHCNSCSADCSRRRYHCPKQADFDLCTECFNSGKFGSDMSSSDFILMEPAEAPVVGGGKWTDQETLLLLEALELFKENWNQIAEHVATKTKAQCMLHFLQMPIEDGFFDQIDDKGPSSKDTADLAVAKDDKSIPKEAPDSAEDKNVASEGEALTSHMEGLKPEDENEGKVSPGSSETGDVGEEANQVKVDQKTSKLNTTNDVRNKGEARENIAMKALARAFEDIGYTLAPENSHSFADLGNPVMGLAAFLVRLVGSDIATASACASIKSIGSGSPGLWLATRHCFLLEDPPDNNRDSAAPESADPEVNHENSCKDEGPEERRQKEPSTVSDGDELLNTDKRKENLDSVSREHPGSHTDGTATKKEAPRGKKTRKEVKADNSGKPKDIPLSSQDKSAGKERSQDKGSARDVNKHSGEIKENCQVTISQSAGDASQPMQGPKDVEMADSLPSEKTEPQNLVQLVGEEVQQAKEAPSTTDASMVQQPVGSVSVPENGSAGEDPHIESKKEKHDCEGTKDGHNIEKLTRAAVSALSAAAVKARLLAKQEEDQIRQLSVSLIEKQLHKLEMKLTFFNEMENLMLRVREQLERSRQRLYHERAQIIAARLGVPPSSSSKVSLPTNRIATNFAHAVPRPPMGMAYSRPSIPMPRPTGTLASAANPFGSTTTGSSGQPSGPDKVSSV